MKRNLKRAVLTGAGGQLGSELAGTAPSGIELIPLTRKELDLARSEDISKKILELAPDVVINAAAYVRVDDAEDQAEAAFQANALAPFHLAKACREAGAALLHVSTDYVFDGHKHGPYTEADTPNPINVYGISKYAGELALKSVLEKYHIVRVSSLYGPRGASGKGGNFVYTILKKASDPESPPLRVVDDILMSPTYAPDAALMIWKMLADDMPYGIYHAANAGRVSWHGFAKTIVEMAGMNKEVLPVSHTEYNTKATRPLMSALESEKGTMLRPWQEGLADFLKAIPPS